MNPKLLHNLSWMPLFVIGLSAVVLGISWLLAGEPWLNDRAANEAALGMTFDKLFAAEVNATLPDYLTIIYRFFGLWVFTIGVLICSYVLITFMGTTRARNTILVILGVFFIFLLALEYIFIPISPFIFLTYGLIAVYWVSLWASFKLNKKET